MSNTKREVGKRRQPRLPSGYRAVLADVTRLIAESRHRALATVNRELVGLYWQIGNIIVQQQEQARWGDAVVEQLSADLRATFPAIKGFTRDNLFRMRQFYVSFRELEAYWHSAAIREEVGTLCRQLQREGTPDVNVRLPSHAAGKVGTLCRQFPEGGLANLMLALSWSHHRAIIGSSDRPAERYFYMAMAVRERWSVRELRRQIDSALFLRYMSVKSDPEKCLSDDAESGDLLPFKDHYILEFLGLEDEHTERDLRKAILANLRQFFLEFGRDLTLVGEEYPLTIDGDTFRIDLLFFHRRLQCLIAVDLKIGHFLPEYVGKSLFYVAALDEQVRLPRENPSIGLILCRSAKQVHVRLALTPAAKKIGVATYQTALPDEKLISQRLQQLPSPAQEAE